MAQVEGELDPKKVAKEAKRLKKAAKRAEAEQDERKKKYNSFSTVSCSTAHPISGALAPGFGLWALDFGLLHTLNGHVWGCSGKLSKQMILRLGLRCSDDLDLCTVILEAWAVSLQSSAMILHSGCVLL